MKDNEARRTARMLGCLMWIVIMACIAVGVTWVERTVFHH